MHIRYLHAAVLFSAGLAASMLLLFAHLAVSRPGVMAANTTPARGTIPMQIVLTPTKDNTIYDTSPPSSNGAGAYLFAGKTASGSSRRALLAFDIAGSVPQGSTIISVTLQLALSRSTNTSATTVALHRISRDWGEGTSDAVGEEGGGAPPSTGDATWQHTFFDDQFWQSPGGDFSATAIAVSAVAGPGLYQWGSTAGMVSDVQSWLDNPTNNFGWILIGNEGASSTAKRFNSRDNSSPATRPQLTIVFTTPEQPTHSLYLPLIQNP